MPVEKPMKVTLRSTDVQRHFKEVVNRAGSGQEHIIVERDGLPVIAIISMAEYDALMRERERQQQRIERFERAASAIEEKVGELGMSEEELMHHLELTRQRVFDERHGNQRAK